MDTYTDPTCVDPRDWRGVPIKVDSLCIYGAPVGRSIAMVEARVVGFTKSGRVNVVPIRRAYGSSYSDNAAVKAVHVGQDRLTIVNELPEALLPTDVERADMAREKSRIREAAYETHKWPQYDFNKSSRERYRAQRANHRYNSGYAMEPEEAYPVQYSTDYDSPCENGCGNNYREWSRGEPTHCKPLKEKAE